jgi:TonB family protein
MEEQSQAVENPVPIPDGELHLLLGDQGDDLTAYRRREAAWISVVVHGVIILALIFMPKWLPKSLVITPARDNNATMIILPDDQLKTKPPQTNKVSDQDRRAQSPVPDKEALRKLFDANRAGAPKPASPPPQPQPQQQAQQATPAPPAQGAVVPPQPQTTQQARLEAPQPKQNPFAITSPSASVEQAIHSAAANPRAASPGNDGDYGSGIRPRVDTRGNFDILSDTRGVDFGPYMKRLRVTVHEHWDPLIPEVALPPMMKKGIVVIEFAIMKDGTIRAMQLLSSSGDLALDRAAWGALTSATPLQRLPENFPDDYLLVRAAFYYNPDKHDFE